jgi:hypothetical protein
MTVERYIYIDSRNRVEPYGNSFSVYTSDRLEFIRRVELVSASIPASMYNISNTGTYFNLGTTAVALPAGFYTSTSLVTDLSQNIGMSLANVSVSYLQSEGKLIFSNAGPFTLTTGVSSAPLGLLPSNTYTSYLASPTTNIWSAVYTGKYVIKSSNICDFSTTTFVFLDIAELRSSSFVDTSSVNGSGGPVRRCFGPIPLNVVSGSIKAFAENSDFPIGVDFVPPLGSIERLTLTWKDYHGNVISFNGFENNAVLLRCICDF